MSREQRFIKRALTSGDDGYHGDAQSQQDTTSARGASNEGQTDRDAPGETPQAFYKRVTACPDIRAILERLAK